MNESGGAHTLTRRTLAAALAGAAVTPACAQDTAAAQRPAPPILFRRGLGVHNMMSFPTKLEGSDDEFVWPPFTEPDAINTDAEIASMSAAGFDFVRLTIGPELFMATRDPARVRFLSNVLRTNVERFHRAGLNVLVDIHPTYNSHVYGPDRIVARGSTLFSRYLEIIGWIAGDLAAIGQGVALELMNEPEVSGVDAIPRWRAMVNQMVAAARRRAPDLPLMVTGHDGGGYQELIDFQPLPPSAGPILYTFHYYDPSLFTHETLIDAARYLTGLEWPADPRMRRAHLDVAYRRIAADRELNPAQRQEERERAANTLDYYYTRLESNPQTVAETFARVGAWADSHGVPRAAVILGEFGVVRTHWLFTGAKDSGRENWLGAVRRASEQNGFGWAVWAYKGWGGMAIANHDNSMHFDDVTVRALGLKQPG